MYILHGINAKRIHCPQLVHPVEFSASSEFGVCGHMWRHLDEFNNNLNFHMFICVSVCLLGGIGLSLMFDGAFYGLFTNLVL